MKKGIITIEHKDHSTVELTNLKTDTFTYNPNKWEGLEDFLNGAVLKDRPDDVFVLELSDNEIKLATRQEIEILREESLKYDGFDGFIIKGRLLNL